MAGTANDENSESGEAAAGLAPLLPDKAENRLDSGLLPKELLPPPSAERKESGLTVAAEEPLLLLPVSTER